MRLLSFLSRVYFHLLTEDTETFNSLPYIRHFMAYLVYLHQGFATKNENFCFTDEEKNSDS